MAAICVSYIGVGISPINPKNISISCLPAWKTFKIFLFNSNSHIGLMSNFARGSIAAAKFMPAICIKHRDG